MEKRKKTGSTVAERKTGIRLFLWTENRQSKDNAYNYFHYIIFNCLGRYRVDTFENFEKRENWSFVRSIIS